MILEEEGLEASFARHRRNHEALRDGLEAMGLVLPVAPAVRLPQLNLVSIPEGVDDARLRGELLERHGLEIGAGLGDFAGKAWRIGLMGYGSNPANVRLCLSALESALVRQGVKLDAGAAIAAADARYDD